jgi:hypothetical protein
MSERGYGNSVKVVDRFGVEYREHQTTKPNHNSNSTFASAVWEVMDEIGNLLITKQSDYGPGNVNNAFGGPINGLLVRIGDKFERLKNLFKSGSLPKHESVEDSFKDMANYAVIALMVQRGTWPKE